jgi:hypothetical protein
VEEYGRAREATDDSTVELRLYGYAENPGNWIFL